MIRGSRRGKWEIKGLRRKVQEEMDRKGSKKRSSRGRRNLKEENED
jgi:hypothetical protein